jgi:hypothetical protein
MNENIVKATAKRLGMTYKELGEAIGYGEEAVSKASRTGEVSKAMAKAIELLLENGELKNKLSTIEELKAVLKKVLD